MNLFINYTLCILTNLKLNNYSINSRIIILKILIIIQI